MIDSNLNITKYANKQDKDIAMGFLSNVDWGAAKYLAKKIQKDQLKEDEKIIFLIDRKAQLIGFASLLIVDIISNVNYGPFLSTVYVEPIYRGQGVAYQLVNEIEDIAKAADYADLYAITQHTGLYEKMDFEFLFTDTDDMDRPVRVLHKKL
ncbi:GNAT family N-acetyltransferase [Aerococcus urinaeequi]|uniref:GNAT family N-acetyltransferase n=1 Tax=Aerococcus urinaeequi TaxID=51665 RepID=UPI003D6C3EE9